MRTFVLTRIGRAVEFEIAKKVGAILAWFYIMAK